MYLHIGGNQMISVVSIIALFKNHPTKSIKSNPLLQHARPFVLAGNCRREDVRSYVLTEYCLYGSPISLETLVKRYCHIFEKHVDANGRN
ncbi:MULTISPECIES: hypothetical protein [Megasphaera]|uniref:DUF370 domain-containing protein n=1 Tax=Megasphaera vaginalis (ex Srinivasan et al. 2021) TaxID=1111454 RepID=U7UJP2_9FIRM|nr:MULTISPECIES: hypothetical protein [Megasphaera]ERT58658.1 hypothetical protein HMPREF1250_1864 [Megasphaera vaginalis (ex Srinivasan et al. 2021)]